MWWCTDEISPSRLRILASRLVASAHSVGEVEQENEERLASGGRGGDCGGAEEKGGAAVNADLINAVFEGVGA